MTARDRAALAAVALGLAVLALYTGAALPSTPALIVGALLVAAGINLLIRTPEDHP